MSRAGSARILSASHEGCSFRLQLGVPEERAGMTIPASYAWTQLSMLNDIHVPRLIWERQECPAWGQTVLSSQSGDTEKPGSESRSTQ